MINKIKIYIKGRCMASIKTIIVLLFTATLGVAVDALRAEAVEVYFNDFETSIGAEWSSTGGTLKRVISPNNREFLGRDITYGLSNETVSLNLTGLPSHMQVTVSFDLYTIQSWDGLGSNGLEIWTLKADAATLLNTTFSNLTGKNQSYPGWYPGGNNPPQTGATEINALGYTFYGDAVYHLTYTFLHLKNSLNVNFIATALQAITDESWGIDNVSVSVARNCSELVPTITGTDADDVLTGTAGTDFILGYGGIDTIDGLGGTDIICGGFGDDVINGGTGDDRIFGEDGDDTLTGGLGNDTIKGGAGDDIMDGGPENNCDGGKGNDTAVNCGIVTNVP